jgi:hypothetical protein
MGKLKFAAALTVAFLGGCLWAFLRPRPPRPDDYHLPDGWRPRAD